jgi:hypothetical protein
MTKNADDERIKAISQQAIGITKDVEEFYRLKAFEIVLSKLLSANSVPIIYEKKDQEQKLLTQNKKEGISIEAKIEAFAAKCNLPIEKLKNVYAFEQEKPVFIVPLQGSHAEKQILVSRYLLAAYEEIYGQKWIGLSEVLKAHGIGSLANLAKNLEKRRDIFRIKGQLKAREYKLVDSAKIETFRMIHELATGQ